MRQILRQEIVAPARVVDLELTGDREASDDRVDVAGFESIWCLARERGLPRDISFWDVTHEDSVSLRDLAAQLGHGWSPDPLVEGPSFADPSTMGLTVAICTHERPDDLRRTLDSLRHQSDKYFSTIVVDNAPRSRASADVVRKSDLPDTGYLIEPEKGLSRARNAALSHIVTPFVAWVDDDEIADPQWVARIKQGLGHPVRPAAVCGIMLPAELETEAQVRFEQYGGFNKGRGLDAEVMAADSSSVVSPLYPLPAVGSGGNMAFRTELLRSTGGFDIALGAGTSTHGGEETKVLCTLLRDGHRVLHWPPAVTWHVHRRTMEELRAQFYGYSAGLSAFYASMIRDDPAVLGELVRLAPHALRDLGIRPGGTKTDQVPDDFPTELLTAGRRGLLAGAPHYVGEAVRNRFGGWHG